MGLADGSGRPNTQANIATTIGRNHMDVFGVTREF